LQFIVLRDKIFFVRLEEVKLLANIKSAEKRILITEKRTAMNKAKKSEIKTYMKKFDKAIEAGNVEEAKALLKTIDKKLKRAAQKNVIHMNNVSRKVSRLTKKLNKAI
jgi:small subunit ribosomal protein S20